MTSNNSDQLTYETKQQIDNFRFLFQSKAILSKSQVRIVERRNTRGIREMYDQIDRLEYCIRKNERSRIDEERHIKRILFEIEKQKRGSSSYMLPCISDNLDKNKDQLESVLNQPQININEVTKKNSSIRVLPKLPQKHRFHFNDNTKVTGTTRKRESKSKQSKQQHFKTDSIPLNHQHDETLSGDVDLLPLKLDEGWVTHTSHRFSRFKIIPYM